MDSLPDFELGNSATALSSATRYCKLLALKPEIGYLIVNESH